MFILPNLKYYLREDWVDSESGEILGQYWLEKRNFSFKTNKNALKRVSFKESPAKIWIP